MNSRFEFLQIEPTTRCNFTCGFCCGRHMDQGDMPFEKYEDLLRLFPGVRHVELQGEGEPMLHPKFFEMVSSAREKGIKVSFITNGSLLSPANVAKILALGVTTILVSMESADAEKFRAIRGGSLPKVIAGIERLILARNQQGLSQPAVGLSVTVLRSMEGGLPEVFALYKRLGLDGGIGLQLLQKMRSYTRHYDAGMLEQMYSDGEAAHLRGLLYHSRVLREINKGKSSLADFYEDLFENWSPRQGACPWLERGVSINKDGFATGCCFIKDAGQFAFGRPEAGGLEVIAAAREKAGNQLKSGKTPKSCQGCGVAKLIVGAK